MIREAVAFGLIAASWVGIVIVDVSSLWACLGMWAVFSVAAALWGAYLL